MVIKKLGIKARSEKPGLLGRTSISTRSKTDVEEAILVGREAVKAAVKGESGRMVGLFRTETEDRSSVCGKSAEISAFACIHAENALAAQLYHAVLRLRRSRRHILEEQLSIGLEGADKSKITIAYEPVWAIGPGKTPPDKAYITKIGAFVKDATGGMDVVYGGGLKQDNAKMLASIPEIDGGLIALTRFQGDIGFYPDVPPVSPDSGYGLPLFCLLRRPPVKFRSYRFAPRNGR